MLVIACGGVAYTMIHRSKEKMNALRQLSGFIERIAYSLQYQQFPLTQLLSSEENILTGDLRRLIQRLITELESQIAPSVAYCMNASLAYYPNIPEDVRRILLEIGNSFGKFDLNSQLKYLEGTSLACKKTLASLEENFPGYTRCCTAYALCIGVILALFLI